jgi:DNA-binding response OmpR family regulator
MYTILILDDEQKHLFATKQCLKQNGFKVFISNSPLHALDLLKKLNPDLLILDVIMPSMSGYRFITKLKSFKQLSKIPFVFLTAKGMTQDRIKAYSIGCSGYISKPFDPDELIAVITNILDKEVQRENEIRNTIKYLKRIREYLQQQYYVFNFNSSRLGKSKEATVDLGKVKTKEIDF